MGMSVCTENCILGVSKSIIAGKAMSIIKRFSLRCKLGIDNLLFLNKKPMVIYINMSIKFDIK
jgi:hypothetical protein